MIIKKEKKNGVWIIHVRKDTEAVHYGQQTKPSEIHEILQEDADVFAEKGADEKGSKSVLLLRFRKGRIPKPVTDQFYDATIQFAKVLTSNRGTFQGTKLKRNKGGSKRKYIMSNIFGFMDGWGPSQKQYFNKNHIPIPPEAVRPSAFNLKFPERFQKTLPLLRAVDSEYKRLVPDKYALQRKKANQVRSFSIPGTAFTTVTLNLNNVSQVHTDKGDDDEGFGNLTVIEHGPAYTGGETCFPQYGLGVDVRTGDVLFMNVHEPHSNLPIHYSDEGSEKAKSERLSVVCYLRKRVWATMKNKSRSQIQKYNRTLRLLPKYK